MKKILVVEDDPQSITFIKEELEFLGYEVEFLSLLPLKVEDPNFQALIARSNEFAAVVWDAEMKDGDRLDLTFCGYVQAFAKVFKGPMIANSRDPEYQDDLKEAGCQHSNTRKSTEQLGILLGSILK